MNKEEKLEDRNWFANAYDALECAINQRNHLEFISSGDSKYFERISCLEVDLYRIRSALNRAWADHIESQNKISTLERLTKVENLVMIEPTPCACCGAKYPEPHLSTCLLELIRHTPTIPTEHDLGEWK